jgi:hypothetical protein
MTLAGQVFIVTVAVVALMQPAAGPEAFATGGSLDLPLCENINNTVRLLLTFENKHTLEKFL